jgi:hypothetical protein
LVVFFSTSCALRSVRHERETSAIDLSKPTTVYVYEFAVDASEVQLDRGGPLARVRNSRLETGDQDKQAIALGHQIAKRVADGLVTKITTMGLPALHGVRGAPIPAGTAVVGGQFADVDEGNRIRRLAIGFHQGQSSVSAHVELYSIAAGERETPLLEFVATTASAPLPGAAVTMGAGAAVRVAGAAAGARELGSSVQADADRLVEHIANSLQAFFAKQGWTAPPPPISIPTL